MSAQSDGWSRVDVATVEEVFEGAYKLTDDRVRALYGVVGKYVGGENAKILVRESGREKLLLESPDQLKQVRNAKHARIWLLSVEGWNDSCGARVSMHARGGFDGASVEVEGFAESPSVVSSMLGEMQDHLQGFERWYSFAWVGVGLTRRWVERWAAWLVGAMIVGMIGLAVLSIVASYQVGRSAKSGGVRQREALVSEGVERANGAGAETGGVNGAETWSEEDLVVLRRLVFKGAVSMGAGACLFVLVFYSFPRMEFSIGDGVERHGQRNVTRRILGVLIVTIVIIPVLKAWLWA